MRSQPEGTHWPHIRFLCSRLRSAATMPLFLGLIAALASLSGQESSELQFKIEEEETRHSPVLVSPSSKWMWAEGEISDLQTCRFWRSFELPKDKKIVDARLRLVVFDSYPLLGIDGTSIGRGGNSSYFDEYNLREILSSGHHTIQLKAINTVGLAGALLELRIQFEDGGVFLLGSDDQWYIANTEPDTWVYFKKPESSWTRSITLTPKASPAIPTDILVLPILEPPLLEFWQTARFQILMGSFCVITFLFCCWLVIRMTVQKRENVLLQSERERIARDLHDDFGAQLTELILQGEVSRMELPPGSDSASKFEHLSESARNLRTGLDEVIWMINSKGDSVQETIRFLCRYAKDFLDKAGIHCRLNVPLDLPDLHLDLLSRRNTLAVLKETLQNVVRHSGASEVYLWILNNPEDLVIIIEDNGIGHSLSPEVKKGRGIFNMTERMREIGGFFQYRTQPGEGVKVKFKLRLNNRKKDGLLFRTRSLLFGLFRFRRNRILPETPGEST